MIAPELLGRTRRTVFHGKGVEGSFFLVDARDFWIKWRAISSERNQPTTFDAVVELFAAYERGYTIARRHEEPAHDPDAMDIDSGAFTALQGRQGGRETRTCHNCGKRGHLACACRSRNRRQGETSPAPASGN
ncbi:hypothetical protein N7535_007288 [Penicillium sp. DV-2018c]|nr:hypothetical protein N7461_003315 [Penicillium sp. DV-2018c]KAJ5565650.1 hypothetical protein N7535_007288 [Penicillium sp. DV-2018c]